MDDKNIPESKAALMEQIEREWEALLHATKNLTPEQMTTPDAGGWSPKDNLGHVAVWEQYLFAASCTDDRFTKYCRLMKPAWNDSIRLA